MKKIFLLLFLFQSLIGISQTEKTSTLPSPESKTFVWKNGEGNYVDVNFGIASNSATSALHIAAVALGLKKGDIFWTSPISFVATANCGLYCGAKIDFVDIDIETFTWEKLDCIDEVKLAFSL